jgi:exonuclease VII small subunit
MSDVKNAKTPETKVKEIKAVAAKIDDLKVLLDKQIEMFQRKAELIQHRDTFIEKRDLLLNYIKEQGVDFDENMDTHQLKLVLTDNRSYRDEAKISISNNMIVRDVITTIIARINIKIGALEKEIVA